MNNQLKFEILKACACVGLLQEVGRISKWKPLKGCTPQKIKLAIALSDTSRPLVRKVLDCRETMAAFDQCRGDFHEFERLAPIVTSTNTRGNAASCMALLNR